MERRTEYYNEHHTTKGPATPHKYKCSRTTVGLEALGLSASMIGIIADITTLIYTARNIKPVSTPMPALLLSAVSNMAWIMYGISTRTTPVIVSNVIGLLISVAIVILCVIQNKIK